ncbi:hypothetical protein ACFY7C_19500 [Streptomyces sp. NPDC012769]|uniref:ATP-binding protein n=1 Tax=Streptomyces sp. NPDC012769 TaxID=3364848 RepID=UPI0036864BAD
MLNFEAGLYSGLSTPQGSLHFPDVLDWDAARQFIYDTPENEIFLGVDGDGDPIRVNLDDDSPHILINAGSGGGKSTLARGIATQVLTAGANAVFLDAKRHSHRWAKNLPGVHYAQAFAEIGDALVSVGMELHRRNEVIDAFPGPIEEAPVGPRIVLIFEEMNATMDALKSMSKKLPEGEYDAMDALADIMFMGRAAKIHVVAIAQFASAEAMGGSAIRENFGYRILARYTKQAWTMLAYDCGVPQPAPKQKGRGRICHAGVARETQFLYLTEEQAAWLVRAAHEYRQRTGQVRAYTQQELQYQARHAQAALARARGQQ